MTFALGLPHSLVELTEQLWILRAEPFDDLFPNGSVPGVGDVGTAIREPFLLFQRNSVPRRISEDNIEASAQTTQVARATSPVAFFWEDIRKCDKPVEELVL